MTTTTAKQICTINIIMPVESDEAAIEIKKKVSAILSEVELVRVDFSLVTIPQKPPG